MTRIVSMPSLAHSTMRHHRAYWRQVERDEARMKIETAKAERDAAMERIGLRYPTGLPARPLEPGHQRFRMDTWSHGGPYDVKRDGNGNITRVRTHP